MAKKKPAVLTQQQQPYDSTLKALFEESTADMVSWMVGEPVEQITELSGEVLKPPLRVDRGYEIWSPGGARIVHIELETEEDGETPVRMQEYFGILYRKYRKPVSSVIMYPFRTSVAEPPLRIGEGEEEQVFKYRVKKLWEEDARQFMREWPASLHVLVPCMKNADYALLCQVLDAMEQAYTGQQNRLRTRLLWFQLFLTRTDTVTAEDRRRIMQKLDQFDNLLSQGYFVQQKMAESQEKGHVQGKKEGLKEGLLEGHIEALHKHILRVVQARFPQLETFAQQRVEQLADFTALDELFDEIVVATDEQTVRTLLENIKA